MLTAVLVTNSVFWLLMFATAEAKIKTDKEMDESTLTWFVVLTVFTLVLLVANGVAAVVINWSGHLGV